MVISVERSFNRIQIVRPLFFGPEFIVHIYILNKYIWMRYKICYFNGYASQYLSFFQKTLFLTFVSTWRINKNNKLRSVVLYNKGLISIFYWYFTNNVCCKWLNSHRHTSPSLPEVTSSTHTNDQRQENDEHDPRHRRRNDGHCNMRRLRLDNQRKWCEQNISNISLNWNKILPLSYVGQHMNED